MPKRYKKTEEHKRKLSLSLKGIRRSEETKKKISLANSGVNHPQWKGGITNDRKYQANRLKEYRHRLGINKKYRLPYNYLDKSIAKKRARQAYQHRRRAGIKLDVKTIQRVYEDNIKEFETLTCIYCFEPIQFGNDQLEHIVPLSYGGTNSYENLAVACQFCNRNKYYKTIEEWSNWTYEQMTKEEENE